MFDIDPNLILRALLFFTSKGYNLLKSPMIVDQDILELTLPKDKEGKKHLHQYYVGSAEQSFYQLIKNGFKPEGSYLLITPCHRDENLDETHLNIFLKIELVSLDKTPQAIRADVSAFYSTLEDLNIKNLKIVSNGDIEINNIEVCSFGSRLFKNYNVSFGTGLALPRFSQAIIKKD